MGVLKVWTGTEFINLSINGVDGIDGDGFVPEPAALAGVL